MYDPRPIYKRGKFLAFAFVGALLVATLAANVLEAGSVQPEVQLTLAQALALGLPVLLAGQSAVDYRRAKNGSSEPT